MSETETIIASVYWTGDLIEPDAPCDKGEEDCECSGVYGDPCEHGSGASMSHGWIDPRYSLWTVWENREDVQPDIVSLEDVRDVIEDAREDGRDVTYEDALADTIASRIRDRIHVDHCDGGHSFYSADSDVNYRTGDDMSLCAHVYGVPDYVLGRVSEIIAG